MFIRSILFILCLFFTTAMEAATGQLLLSVVDKETGKPLACRMHLYAGNKKARKVEKTPFWFDHFAIDGKILLKLPKGNYTFLIERGLEYLDQQGHFTIDDFADDSKEIALTRFVDLTQENWWSGDLDVRRPLPDLPLLMAADDLRVAAALSASNARIPPIGKQPDKPLLILPDRRYADLFGTLLKRAGGEYLLVGLEHSYRPQPSETYFPSLAEELNTLQEKEKNLTVVALQANGYDLPLLASRGLVHSIQILNHQIGRDALTASDNQGYPKDKDRYPGGTGSVLWNQEIYFKLLNCGLKIPPSAGSGSGMAPNPVGANRVYVHLDGEFSIEKWWDNLRQGRCFITNGPLMRATVDGEPPGYIFRAEEGEKIDLEVGLTFSTREEIYYLDIIQDGKLFDSIRFEDYAKTGKLPKIHFEKSGWFLLRAVKESNSAYRLAMTAPFYVEIGGKPAISRQAALFFADWTKKRAAMIAVDDPEKKKLLLSEYKKAWQYWNDLAEKATVE